MDNLIALINFEGAPEVHSCTLWCSIFFDKAYILYNDGSTYSIDMPKDFFKDGSLMVLPFMIQPFVIHDFDTIQILSCLSYEGLKAIKNNSLDDFYNVLKKFFAVTHGPVFDDSVLIPSNDSTVRISWKN